MDEGSRDILLPPSNLPDSVAQDDDLDVPEIQASSNIASPAENLPADIISGEPNVPEIQESTTVSSPPINLLLPVFGRADITSATSDRRCSSDASSSAFSRSTDNSSIEATSRSLSTISQGESSGSHREGIQLVRPPFLSGRASQGESSGSHREGIRLVRPPFSGQAFQGESSGSHREGIRLVRPPFSGQASQGESSGSHREGIRLVRPPFLSGRASQGESSGSHREGIRLVRPPFLSSQASQGESSGSHREGIRLVRPPFLSGRASTQPVPRFPRGNRPVALQVVRWSFIRINGLIHNANATTIRSMGPSHQGVDIESPSNSNESTSDTQPSIQQGESSGIHTEGQIQPLGERSTSELAVADRTTEAANPQTTAAHVGYEVLSDSNPASEREPREPSLQSAKESKLTESVEDDSKMDEHMSLANLVLEQSSQNIPSSSGMTRQKDSGDSAKMNEPISPANIIPEESSQDIPSSSGMTQQKDSGDSAKMNEPISPANLIPEESSQDIPSSSGTAQQKVSSDSIKMDEPMSPANPMPEESSQDIPSTSGIARQKDSDEPTKTESRKEQLNRIKKAEEDEGLEECPPKKGRGGSKSTGTRRRHSRRR